MIVDASVPNAAAVGKNTLIIERSLYETCNDEELAGVIAHEMGHLHNGDSVRLRVALGVSTITLAISSTAVFLFSVVSIVSNLFSRGKDEKLLLKKEVATVHEIKLWQPLKIYALVTRYTVWNRKLSCPEEKYSILVSTKKYAFPKMMATHYELRVKTEERFRQLKHSWYITDFPSPHASLVESHVCFTLLTYSLLQIYLRRNDLQQQTRKMLQTLHADESLGIRSVLVYAEDCYAVFDLDDYTIRVAKMAETPRQRLTAIMQAQKEERLKREQ